MESTVSISTIGVVGAGQMGNGIAQTAAAAGFDVVCSDVNEAAIARGKSTVAGSLARLVKKGSLTAEGAAGIEARITWTTDLKAHADADLIVEAASENVDLKLKIFSELSKIAKPSAILASNTSSISITKIASATDRPTQVVGMHFMNPVPLMQLVELIRGMATSDEVYGEVKAAAEKMGKTTVLARDMPGFIVNRVLMPYINEAAQALYEGIGSVEDIDVAMKLGTNVPMGPLTLADFIGLDTCLAIMEVLHSGLGDSKYRPSPLLRKYVEAGWLGRKSGRGFYAYPAKA
jgi:3-hydroxybutyryl-CoA dehydrogenase